MIIRRRTYSGDKVGNYGYFMRNSTYMQCLYSYSHNSNIYTKCMLKEVPVGNFSHLTSNYTAVLGSGNATNGYAAVGYTDGTTIIVANAKNLYRSTNEGASFDFLCTWNNSSYTSYLTGPITFIYNDGTAVYYYVVYVDTDYASYNTNGYYYLKVVKINTGGNIVSTTTVKTGYRNNNSFVVALPFDSAGGSFFASKPSPWGQIMITEVSTTTKVRWIVVDIPRQICSGVISPSVTLGSDEGATYMTSYENVGQWYNDGSNYGAFHFMYSTRVMVNGTALEYRHNYFKVTTGLFSSNGSLSVTNTRSSLSTIINGNLWIYNGNGIGDPNIFIAGCDQSSSKLTLFVVSTEFNQHTVKAYACNRNFSTITLINLPSDISTILRGGNTYSNKIAGVCVTPDGKYGVALYTYGAFVCDLETKTFVSAYCFIETEKTQRGGGEYGSFMLPAK